MDLTSISLLENGYRTLDKEDQWSREESGICFAVKYRNIKAGHISLYW